MKRAGKAITILMLSGMLLCQGVPVFAAGEPETVNKQGTEGVEMQVIEPEQLEIQLGKEWSGTKFQLKTDAGIYPGEIVVGENGILSVEIGGSKSYKLTHMYSWEEKEEEAESQPQQSEEEAKTQPGSVTEAMQDLTTEEEEKYVVTQPLVTDTEMAGSVVDNTPLKEVGVSDKAERRSVYDPENKELFGIPIQHLLMFTVGMTIALGGLIILQWVQNKRQEDEYDEEDDEEGDEYYEEDEYYDEEDDYEDNER